MNHRIDKKILWESTVHSVINTKHEIQAKHPLRDQFETNSNHQNAKLETKINIKFLKLGHLDFGIVSD